MMSLHTFDHTYPTPDSQLRVSPLLTRESLRRLAWSVFYLDTISDNGRYGFHLTDERAYRLQLPCDEAAFLRNESVPTCGLFELAEDASLGLSAHLVKTAAMRRRGLHFAFRVSRDNRPVDEMVAESRDLEADMDDLIARLPASLHWTPENLFLYHDCLPAFVMLHLLRQNLYIVLGRARLVIYQNDPARIVSIIEVRRDRISHALPVSGIIAQGLKANMSFDPQVGVQAYVALESESH